MRELQLPLTSNVSHLAESDLSFPFAELDISKEMDKLAELEKGMLFSAITTVLFYRYLDTFNYGARILS